MNTIAAAIDKAAAMIAGSESVVVLTGAGISTESGIPDFRGPQGVWTRDPDAEKLSDIHYYMRYPEIRMKAWRARMDHPVWNAEPNPAHTALAQLEELGKLDTLVTQNVDRLHLLAGTSPERLIEIHGNLREVMCMNCGERSSMQSALDRVRGGQPDPACLACSGILKSATVSFGQSVDPGDIERSERAAQHCDLMIALGTTLTVYPVAALPAIALEKGASLVIINELPTAFDRVADLTIAARLGTTLPAIIERLRSLS